jgi:hypothetical protein
VRRPCWAFRLTQRWSKVRFARDSPLEEAGFEPPVPLANESVSLSGRECREGQKGSLVSVSILGGTGGSNLVPSSGESSANLIHPIPSCGSAMGSWRESTCSSPAASGRRWRQQRSRCVACSAVLLRTRPHVRLSTGRLVSQYARGPSPVRVATRRMRRKRTDLASTP